MTAETASNTPTRLRRSVLDLPQVVFQGVTHIAPATNIVFTFPIIALKAGPAMPLSFLLSTIVCFFIGNTVSQFSRYMPSSGGYYSFATRGTWDRSGFMATWSYLIYEILGPAGNRFPWVPLSDMLKAQFHVNIPWWSSRWQRSRSSGCSLTRDHSRCAHGAPGRGRTAHHVRACDHVPGPSRAWFQLSRAANPFINPPTTSKASWLAWFSPSSR